MGFLKKLLQLIILITSLIVFNGCAKSLIKIISQQDDNPVAMFGENGERNFFINEDITDSLKKLWQNDVHGSFNNSSFLFFDSTMFVHDLGGRIHAFNIYTGKQTGVLKYKGSVLSTPVIINFNIITPLVLTNENKTELIYYDFYNGRELNVVEIDGRVINQLLKVDADIIVFTENGIIKRFNSRGNEIWNVKLNTFIRSNPAYSNGKIYFIDIDGIFYCMDYESANLIYQYKISAACNGGITIKNNAAYFGDVDGIVYSVNLPDGNLNWKRNTGSRIQMTPALDDNNLFIGNLSGELFSIEQNSGELIWQVSFPGAIFNSTPLITKNRIIISNLFKTIKIISKSDGFIIKDIKLDERVKMTPAIRDNILFVGFDKGVVRAYEIAN